MKNPYVPFPVKIKRIERFASDNFSMFVDWKNDGAPGQFAQVSLPGIGESPISFASYNHNEMEFNIHEVGSVTNALGDLKEGDIIYVRGPYGKGYPMESLKGNGIVFIGGGCGVAPLKGAMEYVAAHREEYADVLLFMGYRSPDDILFENQINSWRDSFKINISVDKTKPESCYTGSVGFITNSVQEAEFSTEGKVFFVCGPPIMMSKTIEILISKGVHDDQIFLSQERLMHCAVGKCGACMIRGKYTCMDGPVFRYDEVKEFKTD